jgi:hypothetical protein
VERTHLDKGRVGGRIEPVHRVHKLQS